MKTEAPEIRFVEHPAVLVTLEGKPELQAVGGSSLMRVVNTPFTIALDGKSGSYYLDGGAAWYTAREVLGPWKVTVSVPPEVAALRSPEARSQVEEIEKEDPAGAKDEPPEVIVATKPTELISSDGAPKYSPVKGTSLLYMSNTESAVVLDIETQAYYVVLSGRWYTARSLGGPWTYVESDRLPDDFARIPVDSDMGSVLAFVGGTEQARDAVLDNSIPQTSAIDRKTTGPAVTYDGAPKFEPIEGTAMKYAVNTEYSVVFVGSQYYACHQAVWFVSRDPLGPWVVADAVPHEIYTIPSSVPVYNVRYVYVYATTPEVVYVGYTPGYTGSYVYHTTVVYGTGWYYPAWYGSYYYPRPCTWGFRAHYNPWYGWTFGLSWTNGPFTFSVGWGGGYGGWWGPAGYHHGYYHGYHHGYYAGYRAGMRQAHRDDLYNRVNRPVPTPRPAAAVASNRKNDVYTDRNGDIYRRTDGGWQKREGQDWKKTAAVPGAGGVERPSTGATRPSTSFRPPTPGPRPSTGTGSSRPSTGPGVGNLPAAGNRATGLERDYQARQRGSTMTRDYQRSQPTPSRSTAGGRR